MAKSAENKKLDELINKVDQLSKDATASESGSPERANLVEKHKEALKEMKKYYEEMQATNKSIDVDLDKQYKTLVKTGGQLQKIALVSKGIRGTFKDVLTDQKKFLSSVDQWFAKSQELAAEYLTVAKNIGLSEERSQTLGDSFNNAVRKSLKLGYSIEDLRETFSTFAEESGRARILSDDEAENIAKLARGAGLYASEATKLAEAFDLMGLSSQATIDIINEAIGSSREMGLNAGKVIKVLQTNMKTMQNYSFVRGVKGMTEMAKLAVKMRADVGEMLQMADKFYQPEAAIEAAANLQLLGGDIAAAFGDPFETMYLARNKPEELAERVADMTANMMQFNKKTGEFEMPAEARMQLQAVSKELGLSETSITTMARQASKIKNIKMDVSGNITDDDMREGIAGMARMKDGKWVVDFSEGGQKFTKGIDELTNKQAGLLLEQQKDKDGKGEKDFLYEISMNTQTFAERMKNFQSSAEYGFAGEMDVYQTTMNSFLKSSMTNFEGYSVELFAALNEQIGSLATDGEVGKGAGMKEVMRDAFGAKVKGSEAETNIDEMFRQSMGDMTNVIRNGMTNGAFDITKMTTHADLVEITTAIKPTKDLSIGGDGTVVMGPAGAFKLDPRDTYVGADGGFVAGTNLYSDGVSNYSGGDSKVSVDPINVTGRIELVSPSGSAVNLDMDKIKATIQPIIIDALNQSSRNGGTLTGKETLDRGISV